MPASSCGLGFDESIAEGALCRAGLGICLLVLCVAALLSFALCYYAPATMCMQTGCRFRAAMLWGYTMARIGAEGIRYVAPANSPAQPLASYRI